MAWEIEVTDQFREWFESQPQELQNDIAAKVKLLGQHGPHLGRPHADTLSKQSRYPNMKELRIQHAGDAYRVLFAFDPRRIAVLLMGDRKPDDGWYKHAVPKADKLYEALLNELKEEGELD